MIRDEHIDAAVAQGILTSEQAARLRDLARENGAASGAAEPAADPDDERFRLIGGFNDVFVTIGVLLLIAAFIGLSGALQFGPLFALLAMVAAWGLAEFFSRRMRLALPSITLALMFAGAAAYLGTLLGLSLAQEGQPATDWVPGLGTLFGGLAGAGAGFIHDRRFRVPIDTAIMACGLTYAACGLIGSIAPFWMRDNASLLMGLMGLAVFAAALRFDASDPLRTTRRADIAFWLHLLAAPMIVHSVIPLVTGQVSEMRGMEAVGVLVLFAVLGLVAVIIDRRALLVSGLTYAGIAIGVLLSQGVEKSFSLSLTLLVLAALVLGLSAGWRSLRGAILPLLPLGSLHKYIPPA